MANTNVKFATQVDEQLLESVKAVAKEEGRQIQSLVNEAFSDLLEKRKNMHVREHVMSAYLKSHESYASVYEKLAK